MFDEFERKSSAEVHQLLIAQQDKLYDIVSRAGDTDTPQQSQQHAEEPRAGEHVRSRLLRVSLRSLLLERSNCAVVIISDKILVHTIVQHIA